jgi:hypothetical protein
MLAPHSCATDRLMPTTSLADLDAFLAEDPRTAKRGAHSLAARRSRKN